MRQRLIWVLAASAMIAGAFNPQGTPVRGHTREGILRFYRRWYQPENIVLVAVGDHLDRSQMVLLELVNTRPQSSEAVVKSRTQVI